MQLRQPIIQCKYNDKDITADVSKYLTDFSYTDKEHGASDEVSLSFDDKKLKWQNEWFPDKSARLDIQFGFAGRMVPAGVFQINSFRLTGPPDNATIGGLAAGITKAVRTKNTSGHEKKTLKEIAQNIAQKHGFTVAGEIAEINIKRATQNKETDLGYLARLAEMYGYIFSLRDSVITFHDIYDLEGAEPITELDKSDCSDYDFTNQITGSYKNSRVKHTASNSKFAIQAAADLGALPSGAQQQTNSVDTLEIHAQIEDELQAKFKSKAALHKHNKRISQVELTTEGNPYLVAGNNVDLTGFGECSGTYHITQSIHRFSKGGGYTTTITAHKVKVAVAGKKRPKSTTVKSGAAVRPGYVPVYDFSSLNG